MGLKRVGKQKFLVTAAAAAAAAAAVVIGNFLAVGRAEVLHFADGLLHVGLGGCGVHLSILQWLIGCLSSNRGECLKPTCEASCLIALTWPWANFFRQGRRNFFSLQGVNAKELTQRTESPFGHVRWLCR